MIKKILCITLFSFLLLGTICAENTDDTKFRGWKTSETEHFQFIYEDSARETAQAFAAIADEAWNKVSCVYGFPQEKTNVYVTDRMNFVNALTYSVPVELMMFTTPNFMVDFTFRDDWHNLFFTHELVHSANFAFEDRPDKKVLSTLIGPLLPVLFDYNSAWSLEGLTTVLETELLNGGRGRSPYFELNFKAATLDNAFPSYREVEKNGTSYVIGYLMMRSVADRWGLNALSDIERNRPLYGDWDKSVKLVTGEEAEDIYKDMKISLAKRYADERKIPEGLVISPRIKNTSYYKPAVVLDDGSIITMRTTEDDYTSIVKLDPSAKSGRNKLKKTRPEKDLNTVFQETVLFRSQIVYPESYTADENCKVYVTLEEERIESMPGLQIDFPVYSWTKADGLKRLTKKGAFFQPSVSRNGKVLVAMQQSGLKMRLVQIDTESGAITPILENADYDFIQPAVNDDGTKVAFMAIDGKRARVCVMNLSDAGTGKFTVVANDDGFITDPAYPSWNSNGNLTFTSNDRGRLEVYELAVNGTDAGVGANVKPVVADPIGALWAYQGERGLYYWSLSSTGYVLKMKPASEWGNVPSFNGPSMPGEIMHFGQLQRDYPEFQPYEVASEKEESLDRIKETKERKSKISFDKKADKEKKEPLPVLPKKVYRRPEELAQKAENLPEAKTELENEHAFFPMLRPVLYLPLVDFKTFGDDEDVTMGIGGACLGVFPRLQYLTGGAFLNALYYPKINNFSVNLETLLPVGNNIISAGVFRTLKNKDFGDEKHFSEINSFIFVDEYFLLYRAKNFKLTGLGLVGVGNYGLIRHSPETFAFFENAEIENDFNARFGINYLNIELTESYKLTGLQLNLLGIADYDFTFDKPYFGVEGQFAYNFGLFPIFNPDFGLWIRYTDFPSSYSPVYSNASYTDEYLDCKYPGRIRAKFGIGLYFGEVFAETCLAFGKNTVDYETPDNGNFMNLIWDNSFELGYAVNMAQILNVGFTYHFNLDDESTNHFKFYWSVSLGGL